MKRDINLYHTSLQPMRELLTAGRLLVALFILLVVFGLARGAYAYAMVKLVEHRAQLNNEQQALNSRRAELINQLNRQRPERSLLRRTERVELEIASRRALLDEFNRRGTIRRDNLSPVLQELASIHMDGVWLTRVTIQPNGVELEGRTLEAGLIPRWMAGFAQTTTLAAHRFSVVELRRDSRDILSFALLSKPRSADQTNPFNDQIKGIEIDEKYIPSI